MRSYPGKQELGSGEIRKEEKQIQECVLELVSAVAIGAQSGQDFLRGYVVRTAELSVENIYPLAPAHIDLGFPKGPGRAQMKSRWGLMIPRSHRSLGVDSKRSEM